jgi:uncharacterized protein DUF4351
MPSHLHEALLLLFRNRPALAPELLRDALHVPLPHYTEVRIDSADLTDIQPAEYRADMVILLLHGSPVLGIVLEMQLSNDEDKRYVWPVYVVNLRARIRCPVCLLVITAEENVARWAGKAIELGGGNRFVPWVLSLSGVPEITDEERAKEDPELAVLSAMAHARDPDPAKSARIALLAQMVSLGLDAERSTLYCDLVLYSLPEAARRALQAMDASKYQYQSEFARRYFGQGKAAGIAEGKAAGVAEGKAAGVAEGKAAGVAEIVLKQLTTRFGALSPAVASHVQSASAVDLDRIAQRVLTAQTLDEALGPR